jgi:hypothetical protein
MRTLERAPSRSDRRANPIMIPTFYRVGWAPIMEMQARLRVGGPDFEAASSCDAIGGGDSVERRTFGVDRTRGS